MLGCQAELMVGERSDASGQVVLLVIGGGVAPRLHQPERNELHRQQREHDKRHPPAHRHGPHDIDADVSAREYQGPLHE